MAPPKKQSGGKTVRAIERAIEILQCFSIDEPLLTVIEIQRRVGLSRPTLYRLLETLARMEMVRAVGTPQRYALGHGVAKLGHVWSSQADPVQHARPIAEDLWNETKETVSVFVRQGVNSVCVLELPSRHLLAISRGLGTAEHITIGASGKAVLSGISDQSFADVMKTAPDGTDGNALLRQVVEARRTGVAVTRGEVFVGGVGVAAPFFDLSGAAVGSIGVFGPEARIDEAGIEKLTDLVRSAAERLSRELGHHAEPSLHMRSEKPVQ